MADSFEVQMARFQETAKELAGVFDKHAAEAGTPELAQSMTFMADDCRLAADGRADDITPWATRRTASR